MRAWTDYPILEMGDASGVEAPVRECEVLAYDRDKYVTIRIGDHVEQVKAGYIYRAEGRYGTPGFTRDELDALPTDTTKERVE